MVERAWYFGFRLKVRTDGSLLLFFMRLMICIIHRGIGLIMFYLVRLINFSLLITDVFM